MNIRSEKTKKAFIKYLKENPDERFWQAVRNFSKYDFIVGVNRPIDEPDEVTDLFYQEEL